MLGIEDMVSVGWQWASYTPRSQGKGAWGSCLSSMLVDIASADGVSLGARAFYHGCKLCFALIVGVSLKGMCILSLAPQVVGVQVWLDGQISLRPPNLQPRGS